MPRRDRLGRGPGLAGARLARLSMEHRVVVVLRYYVGLSVPEIARTARDREGTANPGLPRDARAARRPRAG